MRLKQQRPSILSHPLEEILFPDLFPKRE